MTEIKSKSILLSAMALMIIISAFSSFGCRSNENKIISLAKIGKLVEKENYTEKDILPELEGISREEIIRQWGEPMGSIPEFYAEFFDIGYGRTITLIYTSGNVVGNITIDEE